MNLKNETIQNSCVRDKSIRRTIIAVSLQYQPLVQNFTWFYDFSAKPERFCCEPKISSVLGRFVFKLYELVLNPYFVIRQSVRHFYSHGNDLRKCLFYIFLDFFRSACTYLLPCLIVVRSSLLLNSFLVYQCSSFSNNAVVLKQPMFLINLDI